MSLVRFRVVSVKDDGPIQLVTGRGEGGERLVDLMRFQPDGLTTAPDVGSLGWAQFAGSRERGVVAGLENPDKRPKNQPGKVLYGPDGQKIDMKPGGDISMTSQSGSAVKTVGDQVYLGGDPAAPGQTFARVQTLSGPSPFVWARIS